MSDAVVYEQFDQSPPPAGAANGPGEMEGIGVPPAPMCAASATSPWSSASRSVAPA